MNSITEERLLRFNHLRASAGSSLAEFLSALSKHQHLNNSIQVYYDFACNAEYNHPGLSKEQYLSHPLRVAKLALDELDDPTIPLVATCLLHNLKEVSTDAFNSFSQSAPREISQAIEVLTIDRNRTNDKSYIKSYYDLIAEAPNFVGIVKVFDKLDNMFLLCLNSDASIRNTYIEEIEEFLIPLATSRVSHLVSYIKALAEDCKEVGFVDLFNFPTSR